jgi:transposase-like protein
VLRAVKAGDLSDNEAVKRLERAPSWVWTALDPERKRLLVIDVGPRTLATAQRVVHQLVHMLAPDGVPLFLTDGFKEDATALRTHDGYGRQPQRCRDTGPMPKPRWMPLPRLL